MRFNKLMAVLFLVGIVLRTNAQEFKLGKVSLAELKEKIHPTDTSAVAAILYHKGRTFFSYNERTGFSVNHEYEFRIKIYKKEGLSWATHQVPYYIGYQDRNDETVRFYEGVTYNLEDGNVIKTKLNSEGSFKKNINEYWGEASITMPNVKVGSVIEFKYVLKSENIVKFPVFNIQYDIPVKYSEYKTEIPEYYIYKPILRGYVEIKTDDKFVNGFQSYQDKHGQSMSMTYRQINSVYTVENVPALKAEEYVDNIKNYRSSILNELERTRFPDMEVKDYSITWEGVAKNIFENKDFGAELNERSYLIPDLKEILKNAVSEEDRLDVIFKFVQKKMNWNNQNGYYTDKGVKQAYLDRTGNVAEINFILIAMLKLAGLNANPVLVSTIENGAPAFPNRTGFNYVICAVEIAGKKVLLDATHKYTAPNILPLNTLNRSGRLIKEDGTSEEINLVPEIPSREIFNLMVSLDAFGNITGKYRGQKADYSGYSFREKNKEVSNDNYLDKLENDLGNIQIKDYVIENKNTELSKPVTETFSFTADRRCDIIGNKIFLNPALFFTVRKNPFVLEERKMPIYFGYPTENKYNIVIEIPEGYVVESLPKPVNITTGESVGSFKYNVVNIGNTIQVLITTSMNKDVVSADFYDVLKEFFQKMIDKQNEKIVLKKI
jgi:hypothetical protein